MTARDTFDLTMTRTIRAPRQKVFDAFVKPELARKWFGIRGFTVTRADIDARVGGRYRMTMQPRSGDPYNDRRVSRDRRAGAPLVHLEVGRWIDGRTARNDRDGDAQGAAR